MKPYILKEQLPEIFVKRAEETIKYWDIVSQDIDREICELALVLQDIYELGKKENK